jgi:hypothetical protein
MPSYYVRIGDRENLKIIETYDYDSDNIIDCMINLGSIFNAVGMFNVDRHDLVNTSDCIFTSRYIMRLFSPSIHEKIKTIDHLTSDILKHNFFDVIISSDKIFHNFTVVKIENLWYLMDSYTQNYTLKILIINDVVSVFNDLIDGITELYKELFKIQYDSDQKTMIEMQCGTYKFVPVDKLKIWVDDYRNSFS